MDDVMDMTADDATAKTKLGKMPDLTDRELAQLEAGNIHWSVKRATGELHRHRAARPSPSELADLEEVFVAGSRWGSVVAKLLAAHGMSIGPIRDEGRTGDALSRPIAHIRMRDAQLSWIADVWALSFGRTDDGREWRMSIPILTYAGEDRNINLLATDLAKHESTRRLTGRVDVVRTGATSGWIVLDRGQVIGWGASQVGQRSHP